VADATLNELVVAAREAGADVVLVGGLQKTSTLVQWAKIQAIDVRSERVVLEKLFTFRGDTDEAGAGPKPSSSTKSQRCRPRERRERRSRQT
jgi:hypothetical protein